MANELKHYKQVYIKKPHFSVKFLAQTADKKLSNYQNLRRAFLLLKTFSLFSSNYSIIASIVPINSNSKVTEIRGDKF